MPSAGIDLTALVRITGKSHGGHGTGFIIRHADDGTYILTCRHVVDEVTSQEDRARVVLIDEKYDAEPIFYPPDNGGPDLAVLRCTAPELREHRPLQLGQPTLKMDTYILSSQRLTQDPEEGPDLNPYTLESPLPPKFKLRNHRDHRIIHGHSGSPVIDYNTHFVIGVVTEVTQFSTAVTDERDAVITATSVEQLAQYWPDMPADLIAKTELALPVDLAPELLEWVKQIGRLTVRLLIAVSAPARYADVNNERSLVLDTINRTLLASGQRTYFDVEVSEWIAPQSMRRVLSTTQSVDEALPCPSFDTFDAVILIVWHNLGPQSDEFSLEALERTTRETARQHPQHRPLRLIYRRQDPVYTYKNDPLHATKDQRADQVQTFFHDLDEHDVSYTAYASDQFADRFLADYQRLLANVIDVELRRPGRPVPPAAGTLPPPITNPYRGLASYRLEDAALFYGRAKEVNRLRNMLAVDTHGFVAVVGASGSGKSSLVRAGLLHRLTLNAIPGSASWPVLEISLSQTDEYSGEAQAPLKTTALNLFRNTPARHSYKTAGELERDLKHASGLATVIDLVLSGQPPEARLVLFIDQFEELFTLIADNDQRRAFTRFLREVMQPRRVNVIITLRADFYQNCLETDLAALLQDGLFSLTLPDSQALLAMIVRPAAFSGLRFEDNTLPVEILRAAGGTAGALPLLSYALQQLAERASTDHVLTRRAYEELGGVEGVIQRKADEALRDLPPAVSSPATLNNLFRRLVNVDENGTLTKKPTVFDPHDPTWTPEAMQLQQALVNQRLLLTDRRGTQSIIEIAHEALLHNWSALTTWIAHTRGALPLDTPCRKHCERMAGRAAEPLRCRGSTQDRS